jgi:DNA polymerase III sliding clamp (beta) subunit (PCNA family)
VVKFIVPGPPVPVILPTKLCGLLAKLKPTSAVLTMPLSEPEHATFRVGADLFIHTKLIAGNYPNYRQVIPDPAEDRITFADPVPVIKFLRRLDSKSKHSAVQLTPLPPFRLELRHHDATLLTPAVLTGHPVPISFNPSMLADMLEAVGHTLSYDGNLSPGLFTAPDKLGVLMCMRTAADEPTPAATEAQPTEAQPTEAAA